MVCRMAVSFFFLILFFPQVLYAEKIWQDANSGLTDLDIRTISVFFGQRDTLICAASPKVVYLSQNAAGDWRRVFSLQAEEGEINFVQFHSSDPRILYLATTKGLFATPDQGKSWQRVFRKVRDTANRVNCLGLDSLNGEKIYIGTEEGLYISADGAKTWLKAGGGLPRAAVSSIAVHPTNPRVLYLANSLGLYKSQDAARTWKRHYVSSYEVAEDGEDDEEGQQELEQTNPQDMINYITIDQRDPKRVFFATGEGVYLSTDSGQSWDKMPLQGLTDDYVNFIAIAQEEKSTVYAATQKGVFQFLPEANSWENIFSGLTAMQVRSLGVSPDARQLFAGTDKGVFKTAEDNYRPRQNNTAQAKMQKVTEADFAQVLQRLSLNEPTIRQVQEAALRYAEVVHPKRIKTLRRNAKLKALLPDFSVDYDKTVTYDSGSDRYYVGPYDWGFNFSWDIGDLVFNEQVRLIDSNTRLMVQLRDDILNEITRLYYQRRKLQTELMLKPPQSLEEDMNKTLRLEELTANIDALTGGFFSQQLKINP